jgi:hypothetical protein
VLRALEEAVVNFGFEDPQVTMWNKMKHQHSVAKAQLKRSTKELQEAVAKAAEEQKGVVPPAPVASPTTNPPPACKSQEEDDEFQAPSKAPTATFKWDEGLDKLLLKVPAPHQLHRHRR